MSIADTPTPPAMSGTWTLTAPDGRQWTAPSPMKCCKAEMDERVPAAVALARIMREAAAPVESDHRLANQCLDAVNTIFAVQQPDGLCLCPPNHCANKWIPGLDNPSCRGHEHQTQIDHEGKQESGNV